MGHSPCTRVWPAIVLDPPRCFHRRGTFWPGDSGHRDSPRAYNAASRARHGSPASPLRVWEREIPRPRPLALRTAMWRPHDIERSGFEFNVIIRHATSVTPKAWPACGTRATRAWPVPGRRRARNCWRWCASASGRSGCSWSMSPEVDGDRRLLLLRKRRAAIPKGRATFIC